MKRIPLIVIFLALASGVTWWLVGRHPARQGLVLYGDVDLRQVELAFDNSERIAAVLVQEGDHVRSGQIRERLDARRLEPQLAEAEATAAGQRQAVERLRNGSRPEEIAEARANVESAQAEARNDRGQFDCEPAGSGKRESGARRCRSQAGVEPKGFGSDRCRTAQRRHRSS